MSGMTLGDIPPSISECSLVMRSGFEKTSSATRNRPPALSDVPRRVTRIAHKGRIYEGHHPPIVTLDLWDEVQQGLSDHLGAGRTKRARQSSGALLIGKLYDDGGNRMSPSWARKGSKRLRYYVSQAALQGDMSKAGTILRVPATDVETLVAEALGKLCPDRAASPTGSSANSRRRKASRVVLSRLQAWSTA
jgi:hypothetical protein